MKIIYIYPVFIQLAGTERVFTDKMNFLAALPDYDVTLLTYEQGSHPFPFPLSSNVKHIDLDVRFFPLYKYGRLVRWYKEWRLNRSLRLKFNTVINEIKPDIIIAPTYYVKVLRLIANCPGKFVRLLESHIGKRYIYNDEKNRRGFLPYIRTLYDSIIVNRLARQFDLLVALSDEDAKDWSRYLKTIVIPNVVHLQDETHSNLDSKRVVFAGRLVEQKGISLLLRIWQLVNSRYPDWRLEIYGEGILHEEIITGFQLTQWNIHVYKPTPDIMNVFCASSIFVLTSVYEPFGLVLPEAMSCGLPVVSFDCDYGPREIITDGVDGYLVPIGNIGLFADRVCQLIESPLLRQKMGQAGIISSMRYSPKKIMPLWVSLFEEITSGKDRLD